jgi:acyl-CoA thioester hydrolase
MDYPVLVRFPVHWAELDALGHVNNARYFTWFETARMALFERVGLEFTGTPAVGPILAHTRCDFLAPVRYPAEILAGTRIKGLGNTSFTMEFGVALGDSPDRLVARGEGVIVLIDYASGARKTIPDALRGKLEALS